MTNKPEILQDLLDAVEKIENMSKPLSDREMNLRTKYLNFCAKYMKEYMFGSSESMILTPELCKLIKEDNEFTTREKKHFLERMYVDIVLTPPLFDPIGLSRGGTGQILIEPIINSEKFHSIIGDFMKDKQYRYKCDEIWDYLRRNQDAFAVQRNCKWLTNH